MKAEKGKSKPIGWDPLSIQFFFPDLFGIHEHGKRIENLVLSIENGSQFISIFDSIETFSHSEFESTTTLAKIKTHTHTILIILINKTKYITNTKRVEDFQLASNYKWE